MRAQELPGQRLDAGCRFRCWLRLAGTLWLLLSLLGCARQEGLTRVLEAGVLRIALDPSFAPFEFVDAEGTLVGFDVDLGREIARRLGVDAHFVVTGYDALYDALTVGRADVILSALYPDPSRTQTFVFSTPYFDAGEVLVVPQGSTIVGTSQLSGARVSCVYGAPGHMAALEWERALVPPPLLMARDDAAQAFAALTGGEADAVVVDHVSAQIAVAQSPGLRILAPSVTEEPYVIAARSEDADLLESIDGALAAMRFDGTLDDMLARWMR